MTSRIHDQNKKLDERRKPLTEKDIAIGLHVIMKQSGWDRFDKGGALSEDQTSISVFSAEGEEFIIEVRRP